MNKKGLAVSLLLLFPLSVYGFQPTPSGTVLTNVARLSGVSLGISRQTFATDASAVVRSVYGLGGIAGLTNAESSPGMTARIDYYVTNEGNDADADARVFVSSYSNQPGYTGTAWTYHLEVGGADVGTNYAVPYVLFGEGAVLRATLVVGIPAGTPTNSLGYFTLAASTASNASHIPSVYTGYNGLVYGGRAYLEKQSVVRLLPPNRIISLYASDGIDTIRRFDNTASLRVSMNTITVVFETQPEDPSAAAIRYLADGTVTPSTGTRTAMNFLGSERFDVDIEESELAGHNFLSFLIESDGSFYDGGYVYSLRSLSDQGYETIVMGNIIGPGGTGYIKLPGVCVGTEGTIEVYSIAGDRVKTILDGTVDKEIYSWDGTDDSGRTVSAGMYFMAVSAGGVREVRKFYVTRQ